MKAIRIAALFAVAIAVLVGVSSASAQVVGPLVPGKYEGEMKEIEGGKSRSSKFDLDLSVNPGTITVWSAPKACRTALPIRIVQTDTQLMLESKGDGVIQGCERVATITALSDTTISGTMVAPLGKFNFTADLKK